jgi:hypothetical protein
MKSAPESEAGAQFIQDLDLRQLLRSEPYRDCHNLTEIVPWKKIP